MQKEEEITRSAGIIGSLTLLSRILGLGRDMVITYFFGAGAHTDAFYVAFRIPNLLRRLLAEGSLTVTFIPVFTKYLRGKNSKESKRVSDSVFTVLFLILGVVSIAGILLSPFIIKLFASGFKGETFDLAVELNRLMFPYIFFISLTALSMGILNSLRHFFAPSFSPVILNISIILFAFLLHKHLDVPILSLALGVVAGGVLQLIFQFPFLRSKGFMFSFSKEFRHPAVKRIGRLMLPQVFGLAVYNLNILVNTQYASYLPEGTQSYLFLSERLIEFPLGVFAVSIATALLPNLSSLFSKGEFDKFKDSYLYALRLMLFIMVPALIGLIVLRVPICNLIYQRGEFGYDATVYTSQALFGYAIGLWAVGGIRITAPAFYSMQDTKTPVKIAFLAFIINIILAYLLGFTAGLKHTGLAIASSLSSIFNFSILFFILNKKMVKVHDTNLLKYILKIVLVSVIMGILSWRLSALANWQNEGDIYYRGFVLLISIIVPAGLYIIMTKMIRIPEVNYLSDLIKKKTGL